jgi:predicted nucleic acid-binding protein
MYKKVFLDANILIDLFDETRNRQEESIIILNYLISNSIKIYTSCDLITTVYYILSNKNKEDALSSIEYLNQLCSIIEFSNNELRQTCKLMRNDTTFKDLEDTIQYVLAKNTKCDLIISNDKKFSSPDIELLNTKQFIENLPKSDNENNR